MPHEGGHATPPVVVYSRAVPTARLDIAYDGSRFSGWAAQPGQRTVQGELESGLERILGQQIELTVAGRTDSGVHATGQVASFEYSGELPEQLAERLNAVLSHDVAVLAAAAAPDGLRRALLSVSAVLPLPRFALACSQSRSRNGARCGGAIRSIASCSTLRPRRSSASTTSLRSRPRRPSTCCSSATSTYASGRDERAAILALRIEAPAFMRNQVRVLVGTLLEVGGGRRELDDFKALLEGAPRDAAGETAPPHGLYSGRERAVLRTSGRRAAVRPWARRSRRGPCRPDARRESRGGESGSPCPTGAGARQAGRGRRSAGRRSQPGRRPLGP